MGATPTLDYDWAIFTGFPAIRDIYGNDLAVFSGASVINNSTL